ncbi:MAG TPA: T9SS type A sorting domain-containing protein [Candidatus Cloacimonetes bacterium]|nr:T9SS type A sorting domain-containing protein [Candidatus Cloacimonadota bacterium]HEX38065.1 T9SS type A sorting domain-containing protein [Candidatus Cloacimonadota bacterium]
MDQDSTIYSSKSPFPGKLAEILYDEYSMGYHLVTLRFHPVEYIPSDQKINLYTDIEFTIEYEANPNPIQLPLRQSARRQKITENFIKSSVENPEDFEFVTGGAQEIIPEQSEMRELDLRSMPSLNGDIPDYVIITSDELKSTFEDLADWKTKKGVPSLIVTTQEIDDNYAGCCDFAEKIRHYLQDAHQYWGDALFVLLGGDTNIIPHRLSTYNLCIGGDIIPTDLYYSDVCKNDNPDYNWNNDGDNIFGEYDYDGVEYGFDLNVGRAPVEDAYEAEIFVDKVISYEKLNDGVIDVSYVKNVLLMAAFGGINDDGEPVGGEHSGYTTIYNDNLPDRIKQKTWLMFDDHDGSAGYNTLYPGDEETSRDNFIAALNNGSEFPYGKFHIVCHCDHSGFYAMGTSVKWKGESIHRSDMDNLENDTPYQIIITHGCKPNRFSLDCICEHYVNNPDGGGVAIIGNSAVGHFGDSGQTKKFFQKIYGTQSNNWSCTAYNLGIAFQYMTGRDDKRKSLNLLGDPEMPVWTDIPYELIVECTPDTITNGENNITVTITNLPDGVDALVCLQKEGEAYAHATVTGSGSTVNAVFTITPDTPGEVDVTVTAHNLLPYEDTIPVTLTSYSHLYITETVYDDDQSGSSYGNGDGQIDAGETIELSLTLTNSGTFDAYSVSAELICDPEFITITQNQSNFGNINAGQSSVSQTNYVFEIDKDTPDGEYVCDTLFIYEGSVLSHTDVFYFQIGSPKLDKEKISIATSDGDDIIEAGDTVTVSIELFNEGSAEATGISAELTTGAQNVTIIQNTVSYGDIASLTSSGEDIDPFVFTISEDYDGETFNLEITNEYGRVWQFDAFNLNKPNPVEYETIAFTGYLNEIDLSWDPVPDGEDDEYFIRGYNIYRDNGSGVFEKLNDFIVEGTSYYKDTDLYPVTTYYYKITAVTESGMESNRTSSLEAWTTLPYLADWPVSSDVGSNIHGSINVSDIDCDGQHEVFTTILGDGFLLGFHTNGEELYDLDNDPGTISGFVSFDAQIWSTPALGDINNDGLSDVVVTTRNDGTDEKKLFVYKTLDENQDGEPDLLWKSDIGEHAWRGPVISDINNDGTLEIIAIGVSGALKVYDNQGNTLWSKDTGYGGYGMPAVADLDEDGYKEIIVGSKDGLFIWQYDGDDYIYNTNPVFSIANKWFVAPPVVVDLDDDGDYEIMVVATQGEYFYGNIYAIHDDGTLVSGWNDASHEIPLQIDEHHWSPTEPPALAVGDIDNDGDIEVVIGGYGRLHAWDHNGNSLPNFPVLISGLNVWASAPLLADIDGDEEIEIIMASRDHNIHAYYNYGTKVTGWPLITDDLIAASPCIADIDNDGKSELIAGNYSGTVYVWETEGDPSKIEWGSYRNNSHNTGVYNGSMTLSGTLAHDEYWIEDVYVVGDVVVPSGVDLVIDNSCRVYLTGNTSISVANGGSIEIGEHAKIYSCGTSNEISISGDISVDEDVIFTALDNTCSGTLRFQNYEDEIGLNALTFKQWDISNESYSLSISNSEFNNSGIEHSGNKLYLSYTDFDTSNVYCSYSGSGSKIGDPEDVEINISTCSFTNYIGYPIYISGYDLYDLSGNTISNCNGGLNIYESGHPKMCIISNNVIENHNGHGIHLYHSYADILGNNVIRENSYGIVGANYSLISIIGNETYPLQMVYDNTHEEIVVDHRSYPEEMYGNKIYDNNYEYGTPDQYLIRCAHFEGEERSLNAENNNWGTSSIYWEEWDGDDRFNPGTAFDYIPVWDPGTPRDNEKTEAELLYAVADSLIEEEEYEDVKITYQSIIDLYTLTDYAIYSMRNLLPMETISGQDFSSLKVYYLTEPNCNINDERTKLSKYLANYCTIKLEQYPEAISFFENIISDPDTELDSVYAVIDAGYTYLLMENGGKSGYIGKMAELKPKSEKEFRIMRDKLLSELFDIKETEQEEPNIEYAFELKHNYPNPFNCKTTISFSLPLSTQKAELKIYNIRGQLVRELAIDNKSGIGSISWDGLDIYGRKVGSGIYFYKLTADKKEIVKKMVLMR